MDEKVKLTQAFQVIKNVMMHQNEAFVRDLAVKFKKDPDELVAKYIRPEYYLPIVVWDKVLKEKSPKAT